MSRFGSIGDQFFDNAGDPLIDGKLYFFEPGTGIVKDTYADINQIIPNTHPVLLSAAGRQPNIFFSGSARAVLTDGDDEQIEERDPVGGDTTESPFSDWNSETVYDVPDIVVGPDGNYYISLVDNNEGNDPTTSTEQWEQVRFISVWNEYKTYGIGDIAQGTDGLLYTGATPDNLNNNPVSDVANWSPAVEAEISPVIRAAGRTYAYNNF